MKPEPPADAAADVDYITLVDGAEPQPLSADPITAPPRPPTPIEIPTGAPPTEPINLMLVENDGGETHSQQDHSVTKAWTDIL